MYRLYLKQNGEQLLLPVTPAEIETRTGNQNKTAYILDFGEMNLARKPGLTEIRFTALLPGRAYSFVQTEGGFREPEYFLNRFKEYKASAKPVQMILFRRLADGKQKFCGNTEVLLEEYTVTEKGGEQGDFWVEFFWKEWRAAKSIRYSIQGNSMMAQGQARQAKQPAASAHALVFAHFRFLLMTITMPAATSAAGITPTTSADRSDAVCCGITSASTSSDLARMEMLSSCSQA